MMNLAWQLGRDSGARAIGVAAAALLTAASSAQLALPEPPENEEQPWYGVGLSVETGDIGGNAFARTVTRTDTPFIWSIDSGSSSISAGTPGNSATSSASAIPGKLGAFSRAEASGLFSVAGSGRGFNPVKPTSYGATAGMRWFDTQIDGDADFTAIGLNLELDGSGSMSHFPSFGPRAPVQEAGVAVTVQVHYDDFDKLYEGNYHHFEGFLAAPSIPFTEANGVMAGYSGSGAYFISIPEILVPVGRRFSLGIFLATGAGAGTSQLLDESTVSEMDFSHTLSLPTTGPVFTLNAGFTANAPSMGIFNNRFGGTAPVPDAGSTGITLAIALAGLLGLRKRECE